MKQKTGILALLLCLSLLTACGTQGQSYCPPADETLTGTVVDETPITADDSSALVTKRFRIVDGAENGSLLLAGLDGSVGDIYRLGTSREGMEIYLDGEKADAAALKDGMIIQITWDGLVLETYPAQIPGTPKIEAWSIGSEEKPDDRCGLYLQVLEDLWDKDVALNEGLDVLGLDLSGLTHLSEAEKSAVAHRFGELHGLEVVTGSLAQLLEQGYITMHPLENEGTDILYGNYFYEWENGILYSITTDEDAVWNLPMLTEGEESPSLTAFTAQKWRTSLGAYGFSGCTARRAEDGSWSYTIGAEFIS